MILEMNLSKVQDVSWNTRKIDLILEEWASMKK